MAEIYRLEFHALLHAINLGKCQIVQLNVAGRSIDPAGNFAAGLDQQCGDPPGHDRLGDLC
jgi:hypothetical protein